MGRLKSFRPPKASTAKVPKSLRNNCREYAQWATGLPYLPPKPLEEPHPKPGRGVSGESSN